MDKNSPKTNWNEPSSLSTSLPSTSPRSRKNEKLQAIYEKNQAKNKLQIISNRVNQLNKMKSIAEKEIEKLQNDIQSEEASINFKMKLNEKRRKSQSEQEEMHRYKKRIVKKSREENKKNIRDFTDKLLREKQSIVKEKKEQAEKWKEEHFSGKNKDLETRFEKHKKIRNGYVKSLRERCLNQRQYREKIRDQYYESILDQRKEESEALDRISDLEKTEASIIQELSKTVDIKRSLRENLVKLRTLTIS